MKYNIYLSTLLLLSCLGLKSQSLKSVINLPSENFRSIEFYTEKPSEQIPIVSLNSTFYLEFDDIDADMKQLKYKITRCEYTWEPSHLFENEYIDGFASGRIENIENSFNTYAPYSHYKISFPNDRTKITKSGNYLLSIYLDSEDEPLFSLPFIIYENKVKLGASVEQARDLSIRQTHHQVNVSVSFDNLTTSNPAKDIKVEVMQNRNPNTLQKLDKANFILGNKLEYSYPQAPVFEASSEFRDFDTKNLPSASLSIARVDLKTIYEVLLKTDSPEADKTYVTKEDLNGRFFISSTRSSSDNLQTTADYSWVTFRLNYPKLDKKQNLYVIGSWNMWAKNDENKMVYDEKIKIYTSTMLLKQGFYNYKYSLKDDESFIDGSKYETVNSYQVLVYFKDPLWNAHRCVGFVEIVNTK